MAYGSAPATLLAATGRLPKTAARALSAAVVLAALLAAAHAAPPAAAGALALMACAATGRVERLAGIVVMAAMFGMDGAGAFALMGALMSAPLAAALRGLRPVTALACACACVAGLAAASPGLETLLPQRFAPYAAMLPALAFAAPRRALDDVAMAMLGPERAGVLRLNALPLVLVAMVCGAAVGGLAGAAIAWAGATLALPAVVLIQAGRPEATSLTLGALAALFVGATAASAAATAAGGSIAAALAAAPIGVTALALALRVHAPAAAGRLLTRTGRRRQPPRAGSAVAVAARRA